MKYVVFLGDGMADYPFKGLGGQTPLDVAHKPHMDEIAQKGILGLVKTIDDSLSPGSDVANLSVMGYDPMKYYTGRSPLEALSIGVPLSETDVTFRANLVTLTGEENYEDKTMADYSSGEITTQESGELIAFLKDKLHFDSLSLYKGISYRHLLVWDGGSTNVTLTPPHDISDRVIGDYLPKGDGAETLLSLMKQSYELLCEHPVNLARAERGLAPANSLWIWGEGRKPALDSFQEKYGIRGSMISAVDLLKGIGKGSGMQVVEVEGATGNIDTNFDGKAQAAIDELKRGQEFVYIHVEAPDECGHHGDAEGKVKAIELIDEKIVAPVMAYLESCGEDYRVLLTPDHPTPLEIKTHARDAVPFAIYDSASKEGLGFTYNEQNAKETGVYLDKGYYLMQYLLHGEIKRD